MSKDSNEAFDDFLDALSVYGIEDNDFDVESMEGEENTGPNIFVMDESTPLEDVDFEKVDYVYITETLSNAAIDELVRFIGNNSPDIFLSCLVSEESAKTLIQEVDYTGVDTCIIGFESLPYQNSFDKLMDRIGQLEDESSIATDKNIHDVYRLLIEGYYWLYALSQKEGKIDNANRYLAISIRTYHFIQEKTPRDKKVLEHLKKAQTEKVLIRANLETQELPVCNVETKRVTFSPFENPPSRTDSMYIASSSSWWQVKPSTALTDTRPSSPEIQETTEQDQKIENTLVLHYGATCAQINDILRGALMNGGNTSYYILLAPYLNPREGSALQKDFPTIHGRKVLYGFEQYADPKDFDIVLELLRHSDIRKQSGIANEMALYCAVVIEYWKAFYKQDVFEKVSIFKHCQRVAKTLKGIPYAQAFLTRVEEELNSFMIPTKKRKRDDNPSLERVEDELNSFTTPTKKQKRDDNSSPSCNPNMYMVFESLKDFTIKYSDILSEPYAGCYCLENKPRVLLIDFSEITSEERRDALLNTFMEKSTLTYVGDSSSNHTFLLSFESSEDVQKYLELNFQPKSSSTSGVSEQYSQDNASPIVEDGTKKRKSRSDSADHGEIRTVTQDSSFSHRNFLFK